MKKSNSRVTSLDGLRGVAIILVLFFHAYSRWPEKVWWLNDYSNFFLFRHGFLGVELFFLISGYVIYMTLESCSSLKEFAYRRWLRLFPAMLIATILVYFTADFFIERPAGQPNLLSILPGLLFIEPWFLNKFFSTKVIPLEGVFWSLYVEVKFYVIFGLIYFSFKEKALAKFVGIIVIFFVTSQLANSFNLFYLHKVCNSLEHIFSINHFGWFASGALIYKYHKNNNKDYLASSVILIPISYLMSHGFLNVNMASFFFVSCLFFMFVLSIYENFISRALSNPVFLFFGYISYPLYLIHENSMISMTIKTRNIFPEIPSIITPLPGIFLIIIAAYLIAKFAEPFLRQNIKKVIND